MQNRGIKAVIFGVGAMGKQAIRLMVEKRVTIVRAIGHKRNIGKDIGELSGIHNLGVTLVKYSENSLDAIKADVAMLSTEGSLEQISPIIRQCVENKMNVITIAEEAFYPWQSSPDLAAELDALAKAHGVTIYGTGIQDVFWSNLCVVLSGACHKITSISGENIALLDNMGPAVARECFVGNTVEEFSSLNDQKNTASNPYTASLVAIAGELGLTVYDVQTESKPIIAKHDLVSETIGSTIQKGQIVGLKNTTKVNTSEGIALSGTLSGKLKESGDKPINRWVIKGEPNLDLEIQDMHGEITTCTNFVSRIPDVINATPGYKTVMDLPKPTFKYKPLYNYI